MKKININKYIFYILNLTALAISIVLIISVFIFKNALFQLFFAINSTLLVTIYNIYFVKNKHNILFIKPLFVSNSIFFIFWLINGILLAHTKNVVNFEDIPIWKKICYIFDLDYLWLLLI
jgi:hypothetical protein